MEPNTDMIPHLAVRNAPAAIEFYVKFLGFKELNRMLTPDGKVLHCVLQRNGHTLFLAEEFPNMDSCKSPQALGGSCITIHVGDPDVDAAFAKAISGGARVAMPIADMFWGDRYGKLVDPFGHHWSISTHKRDVSPDEMKKAMNEMFKKMKPA